MQRLSKLARIVWSVLLAVVLYVPRGAAQVGGSSTVTSQPTAPSSATSPPGASIDANPDSRQAPVVEAQIAPDTRPVTGVQSLAFGGYSNARNSFVPSVSLVTQLDNDPSAVSGRSITSVSYLLGRLNLNQVSRRAQRSLDYTGGARVSTDGNNGHATIQELNFLESFDGRRWSGLLAEQVSYLPESAFGFGGVGGLGFLGNVYPASPFLQIDVTPSQLIPTSGAQRLSNTVAAQAGYRYSSRASWTVTGSYGLLRFSQAAYINSSNAMFQAGYNYRITLESTVAVLYRFDAFRFAHLAQGIDDHAMQLAYARRITGRLAFQVAAGPDLQLFQATVSGPASRVSWSMHSELNYLVGRTGLEGRYDHSLTGGSGVLVGAQADQVQGTVGRGLTRMWKGSVSVGYARNGIVAQTTSVPNASRLGNWNSTLRFTRQLPSGADFFLAYGARLQGANTAVCAAGLNCPRDFVSHEISLGFNWSLHPARTNL